mgnify:CR=1 FL=1
MVPKAAKTIDSGDFPRRCAPQIKEIQSADESEAIRRAAGAESPTFDFYSATGAETGKVPPKSHREGGSLMNSDHSTSQGKQFHSN